jgi:triosephosphate isomerase
MFGRRADLAELDALAAAVAGLEALDIAVCPPAVLLAEAAARVAATAIATGGQDCWPGGDAAQTGDINAAMLADAGARYCIVGHSERRRDHGETDALVARKAAAVGAAGLAPVICVGESLEERKAGRAEAVVAAQIAASLPAESGPATVVAYEPVWAIGTGLTPTLDDIAAMHVAIRGRLGERFGAAAGAMRILYGGSVKPANAGEIFSAPDVDGALVGGASLKAADFAAIIRAHPAAARR